VRFTRRNKWIFVSLTAVVVAALIGGGIWYLLPASQPSSQESRTPGKPEAPPDLAKLRDQYTAAMAALDHNDPVGAARQFDAFTFGNRAVEEYRLYYLATARKMAGETVPARATLAKLWDRHPRLIHADEAGSNLGALYDAAGHWDGAADTYAAVAVRSDDPQAAAAARWQTVEERFRSGDVTGALFAARNLAIKNAASPQAGAALAVVRALSGLGENDPIKLTPEERLERAVGLLRDGDAQNALEELQSLEPDATASLRPAVQLNRGLALYRLRRFEEASKALDPLASGSYRYAIPALYHASKSYRTLANSINPIVIKTVMQKKQVGTTKVKQGKGKKAKVVSKPKFANVKTNVQLVDLAKKSKKDELDRLATERLKDLLSLPLAPDVRVEVLTTLIGLAEAKSQDDYERDLIAQLLKVDQAADPGLQHFWDKGWAAYARGDLNGAKPILRFIADTYLNPNVKRQADYWYARVLERQGQKAEAAEVYQRLAGAPYEDVYALNAEKHGAKRQVTKVNPLTMNRPDWGDIAEKSMPAELRLGYELTALSDMKNARLEIQKNINRKNQPFADALLSDLYHAAGNTDLTYRSLRRAFPQLATVEQDSVPPYFLKMYYPIKYESAIKKYSGKNGVDPYLVMGLILQESYFNPRARSAVGAIGLMQIMPATGKELGQRIHGSFNASRLENPETNIELGTFHLKHMIDLFGGNVQLAVASYNAGQGNVMKWRRAAPSKPMDELLESIPFPETRNYVKRVTLLRSSYERMTQ
jgi:soluble lytic murein transglycosylase-like protein